MFNKPQVICPQDTHSALWIMTLTFALKYCSHFYQWGAKNEKSRSGNTGKIPFDSRNIIINYHAIMFLSPPTPPPSSSFSFFSSSSSCCSFLLLSLYPPCSFFSFSVCFLSFLILCLLFVLLLPLNLFLFSTGVSFEGYSNAVGKPHHGYSRLLGIGDGIANRSSSGARSLRPNQTVDQPSDDQKHWRAFRLPADHCLRTPLGWGNLARRREWAQYTGAVLKTDATLHGYLQHVRHDDAV